MGLAVFLARLLSSPGICKAVVHAAGLLANEAHLTVKKHKLAGRRCKLSQRAPCGAGMVKDREGFGVEGMSFSVWRRCDVDVLADAPKNGNGWRCDASDKMVELFIHFGMNMLEPILYKGTPQPSPLSSFLSSFHRLLLTCTSHKLTSSVRFCRPEPRMSLSLQYREPCNVGVGVRRNTGGIEGS